MAERYQQFLGAEPGLLVEIVDDSGSPYLVRTADGFEFYVSADDFRAYYRKDGASTPSQWSHLTTDPEKGWVDSRLMEEVTGVILSFEDVFQDFDKARSFVREAVRAMESAPQDNMAALREWVKKSHETYGVLPENHLARLAGIRSEVRALLMSDSCAAGQFPLVQASKQSGERPGQRVASKSAKLPSTTRAATQKDKDVQIRRGGMKNVEMRVTGDLLTLTIDLSKEFGASKSGKTTIVASTEGNKSVPGRDEKIGLNVYRQETKKGSQGRRRSFKNVDMDVQGDMLTLNVDLSKEQGPSKSGKTIMIASTEGNQAVFGRDERIGLNVYKKPE
jgi:hypothetical protein